MKFQNEIELVHVLKASLKNLYPLKYVEFYEEVSLGYGIADLVISYMSSLEDKISHFPITLTYNDIAVYYLIRNYQEIGLESIIESTKASKKSIANSLMKLETCSYIKLHDGVYSLKNPYEVSCKMNFAIEAKLKDWKRALKQAYRYKWFAEYSYVVLDAHYAKPALKNLELFKKYNVGLASISIQGVIERHFNPIKQEPIDPKMKMLFSERIRNTYTFAR
jgi:hypothetical protein